jgi:hypothetical protein
MLEKNRHLIREDRYFFSSKAPQEISSVYEGHIKSMESRPGKKVGSYAYFLSMAGSYAYVYLYDFLRSRCKNHPCPMCHDLSCVQVHDNVPLVHKENIIIKPTGWEWSQNVVLD